MTANKEININIDKKVATNTILFDKLRQVKSNYHHIIFYQPLNKVEEEQKKATGYYQDGRKVLHRINHPFRCYECSQPFLAFQVGWSMSNRDGLIKREHLFLLMEMFEDNDIVKYSAAMCCKCAEGKCDCREWFIKLERKFEENIDSLQREIRTMKRCRQLLDEELRACRYEDEKEVVRGMIGWKVSDSRLEDKEKELKTEQEKLEGIKETKIQYETYGKGK